MTPTALRQEAENLRDLAAELTAVCLLTEARLLELRAVELEAAAAELERSAA